MDAADILGSGHAGSTALTHSRDVTVRLLDDGRCIIAGDCFPGDTQICANWRNPLEVIAGIAQKNWGRYIVVAHDPSVRTIAIYRDPSGMIPCYYSIIGSCVSISTGVPLNNNGKSNNTKINWDGVIQCLLMPHLRSRKTCLDGVYEVMPGEAVVITHDGVINQQIWNPLDYLGYRAQNDFTAASELLMGTIADAVGSWCDRYRNPLISVSGGFDSSVLATLASSRGSAGLLHFYTASARGDERPYATGLAEYLKLPLHTTFCKAEDVDVHQNFSSFRPRPSARSFTQSFDKASADYAAAIGSDAHLNGGGGDNVFGKMHSAYPLVDRYRKEGFSPELVTTALDICRVTGASLPSVLRQAIEAILKGRGPATWYVQPALLADSVISSPLPDVHVWVDAVKHALPGQRQLVRNIARATALTDYMNIHGDLPTIYPFLSQPIMELCLSFPTWFWVRNGRDRALARAAVHDLLPPQILDRTSKGAFDGLTHGILEKNRAAVFDDLENGVLADRGLIDVPAIKISKSYNAFGATSDILYLHEIEIWCRSWL